MKSTIYAALSAVLPNTFAVELPPNPQYPAAVFQMKAEPESGWSAGGAAPYVQHEVTVVTVGPDLPQITQIQQDFAAALEAIPGFMWAEDSGDAGYEDDPDAYGLYQTVRIRARSDQ